MKITHCYSGHFLLASVSGSVHTNCGCFMSIAKYPSGSDVTFAFASVNESFKKCFLHIYIECTFWHANSTSNTNLPETIFASTQPFHEIKSGYTLA